MKYSSEKLWSEFIGTVRPVLAKTSSEELSSDTLLMGGDDSVDSMTLVELCVGLEDLAMQLGFAYDWTSDSAMSKSRSVFRTLGTLYADFVLQWRSAGEQ